MRNQARRHEIMENHFAIDRRGGPAPSVFVLNDTAGLGKRVCSALGQDRSPHEEIDFDDGEQKARPLVEVRGCDAYVLQSLHGDPLHSVGDKLCRLLFFIGALKDAAAARVTAVVPYLAYARKDRRTRPWDGLSTRYVASLFESVGTDAIVTVDVHNVSAFENAFRCHTEHLMPHALLAAAVAPLLGTRPATVVAPDAGATHRAHKFRMALSGLLADPVEAAFAEKHRRAGQLSGELFVGDVAGRDAVIVDDLVASGATLARTAERCRALGARQVLAVATHGLFTGDASLTLSRTAFDQLVVTDTVPPFRLAHGGVRDKLLVVGIAEMIADAIRRLHAGAPGQQRT